MNHDTERPHQPGARRPIASRETWWAQALAGWLAHRGVSANAISVAGMVCGIAAGVALAATAGTMDWPQRGLWLLGAVLVQLRLAANLLDGMVAIATGTTSALGELFNEVPDRFSDAATLIGLGCAAESDPLLGCLAAGGAVLTAYVRVVGQVAGAGPEFCGPMAKQHRMFLVSVAALYLAITPGAWQPDWEGWGLPAVALLIILVGCVWTVIRRLWRIVRNLKAMP